MCVVDIVYECIYRDTFFSKNNFLIFNFERDFGYLQGQKYTFSSNFQYNRGWEGGDMNIFNNVSTIIKTIIVTMVTEKLDNFRSFPIPLYIQ